MRLHPELADALEFRPAAQKAVAGPLLQMPHLITDRSLVNAVDTLALHTRERFKSGYVPVIETIAMPKRGFGPRPIALLSPEARSLYHALVARLTPRLPSSSRAGGIEEQNRFGTDATSDERLVDFDIAACYEYIDHRILSEELIVQTLDATGVQALMQLLSDLYPRGLGLPQAMDPSHTLADTFLSILERDIIRSGYRARRFADDFRLITNDWGAAHEAIERAVEIARMRGLVLADGKTQIRSARQIQEELDEREAALQAYRDAATDELRSIEFVQTDYEDFDLVETEPDPEDVDFVALARVVEDWVAGDKEQRSVHAYFGARALRVLQRAPERVNDEWLVGIAEREPIRVANIARYIASRDEAAENWATLGRLTRMPRQSPWARLWLLRSADEVASGTSDEEREVVAWAQGLLADRHESVRAEAAWLLARRAAISVEQLAVIYVEASDITRAGIAASVGARERGLAVSPAGRSIRDDSALTAAAYDWAQP